MYCDKLKNIIAGRKKPDLNSSGTGKDTAKEMNEKQGYCITTKCFRLRCSHPEWLASTQDFYNRIEKFYYDLYLNHEELWEKNSQESLRFLEMLSLPGKEKRVPERALPWEDVPTYFRRAAANAGIAAAKSHLSRGKNSYVTQAVKLNSSVVYYSRMYRDFSSREITLKVWDGQFWKWMRCRLYGEELPANGQPMSPSVTAEGEFFMLHVPVKEPVPDASSVKERMKAGKNICALQFTNGDAFAVASICDKDGQERAVRFFGGGREYAHHCRRILEKIEKSRESLGDSPQGQVNRKYWNHLKNLTDYHAHRVSREIIRFCEEYQAGVIALPRYNEEYSRRVMIGAGNWSPLHLSTRIRNFLQYKGWKAGIIVIEVHAAGTGSVCARCGGKIIREDEEAKEFFCEAGHRGNKYLNAARNLAVKCRGQFEK